MHCGWGGSVTHGDVHALVARNGDDVGDCLHRTATDVGLTTVTASVMTTAATDVVHANRRACRRSRRRGVCLELAAGSGGGSGAGVGRDGGRCYRASPSTESDSEASSCHQRRRRTQRQSDDEG